MKNFGWPLAGLVALLAGKWLFVPQAVAAEGRLEPCLAAAADYSPVYPTRSFPSPLHEVTAVFQLGDQEAYRTLSATWIAVDVGTAAPPNYQIAKSQTDLKDMKAGKFRFELPQPMPVGRYRLDVEADGKPWKSVEFSVLPASDGARAGKPEDLLALLPGRTWTYSFVQEAASGARISFPDLKPDADGRFRAKVTMTVAGFDDWGAHVATRRNDTLVFEEWWNFGTGGLAATRRKQGSEFTALDPPQLLLPLPLPGLRNWDYKARDGSFSQTYTMWGPVPVQGPYGEAPGYVVLALMPPTSPAMTLERHFLPGVGMVREVLVQAWAGKMLSRQEMVLTDMSD